MIKLKNILYHLINNTCAYVADLLRKICLRSGEFFSAKQSGEIINGGYRLSHANSPFLEREREREYLLLHSFSFTFCFIIKIRNAKLLFVNA